ncbi:hypothetical protein PIB30_090303 [Stylosanthes scabra]|uniref:Uncharacterized protein n=1 Tax=Stylosanthes scabra TaxID=79078 RepID=A0ABU6SUM2_9FABA|nr:hypothetical protein [Stylosanthes scabra]
MKRLGTANGIWPQSHTNPEYPHEPAEGNSTEAEVVLVLLKCLSQRGRRYILPWQRDVIIHSLCLFALPASSRSGRKMVVIQWNIWLGHDWGCHVLRWGIGWNLTCARIVESSVSR